MYTYICIYIKDKSAAAQQTRPKKLTCMTKDLQNMTPKDLDAYNLTNTRQQRCGTANTSKETRTREKTHT